jgi:hypothetical protein
MKTVAGWRTEAEENWNRTKNRSKSRNRSRLKN